MDPKIRDYVGIAVIAALFIFIVGGLQFVAAYSRSAPISSSFTVTGEGKVTALPDTAEFSFGITTQGGTDVTALQSENTTKANAAIDYVRSEGIEAKDITTSGYNISPRYDSTPCPTAATETKPAVGVSGVSSGAAVAPSIAPRPCSVPGIVGYSVDQTVTVKVRDFSKIGTLLAGVTSKGANNVSGIQFTIHDKTAVENDARAKAIGEAEDKAKAMARAGHFRLGRIVSIQESGSTPPMYYAKAMDARGAGAAPAPDIQPGSQDVTSNVTITYEIR